MHSARLAELRGIAAFGLGALFFLVPEDGVHALERLLAAAILFDAVLALSRPRRTGLAVVEGALGILAAIFIALVPGVGLAQMSAAASAWAILAGLARGVAGLRGGGPAAAATGGLSLVWGVLTPLRAATGTSSWAAWFGTYALLAGAMQIVAAIDARRGAA